jgi:hypothetical protein
VTPGGPAPAEAAPGRPDLTEAVGSFFRHDPGRLLAMAARLRGPGRVVDSTVRGDSMGRTIPAGSRIRIALVPEAHPRVGEVVAFLEGTQVVVHRVVHRGAFGPGRGYLLTRGDASLVPDLPLPERRILGPVTVAGDGDHWPAPGPRPRRSLQARLVTGALHAVTVVALWGGPGAATAVVSRLRRAELLSRRLRRRLHLGPGQPLRPA